MLTPQVDRVNIMGNSSLQSQNGVRDVSEKHVPSPDIFYTPQFSAAGSTIVSKFLFAITMSTRKNSRATISKCVFWRALWPGELGMHTNEPGAQNKKDIPSRIGSEQKIVGLLSTQLFFRISSITFSLVVSFPQGSVPELAKSALRQSSGVVV
jgi:hypothetical protein